MGREEGERARRGEREGERAREGEESVMVRNERLAQKTKCGWGVPLPTFSIEAEGPKMALQLGLVPALWVVIHTAQLHELLSGHDGTDGRISSRNEQERKKEKRK